MLVHQIIEDSGLPRTLISRDSGLSPDALHSWLSKRRTPQPESLRQLAAGLRQRGAHLNELAAELEKAAGES